MWRKVRRRLAGRRRTGTVAAAAASITLVFFFALAKLANVRIFVCRDSSTSAEIGEIKMKGFLLFSFSQMV